jgi:hypothetical protein
LKEFQKAVHEGQRDGDEGQHLMLVNHVVKALKEQVKPSSLRPHTLVRGSTLCSSITSSMPVKSRSNSKA